MEDVLKYLNKKIEEQESLILALSDETKRPTHVTDNYFEIIRDKHTGVYYFNFLFDEDDSIEYKIKCLSKAKEKMILFGMLYDIDDTNIDIDDIYDFTSLTSAKTFEELYAKFKMTVNYFMTKYTVETLSNDRE